jgi:hypothetical protein
VGGWGVYTWIVCLNYACIGIDLFLSRSLVGILEQSCT